VGGGLNAAANEDRQSTVQAGLRGGATTGERARVPPEWNP